MTLSGHARYDSAGDVVNRGNVKIGVGEDYAGITAAEVAALVTLDLVNLFHKFRGFNADMPEKISNGVNGNDRITVGANGDYDVVFTASGTAASNNKSYEPHVYHITAATKAITAATKAGPCVITAVGHGRSNGDEICIVDAGGMVELNNKIYKCSNVATDTIELENEASVDVDSSGFTTYTSGGTIQLVQKILAHGHQTFGVGADFATFGGKTFATLVKDNFIELYIRGTTDTTNFTFDDCNLSIKRVG